MIKLINATDTFPLRRAVLRKNLPNEPHEFNGDFDESTFHLGFYEKLGYRIEGDLFVIKPIGFHYLMSKEFN